MYFFWLKTFSDQTVNQGAGAAWFKGVMQVASYALRVWGSQEENSLDDSWYEYDHDAAILRGRYHHPTSQIIFYEEYQLPKIEILPF